MGHTKPNKKPWHAWFSGNRDEADAAAAKRSRARPPPPPTHAQITALVAIVEQGLEHGSFQLPGDEKEPCLTARTRGRRGVPRESSPRVAE